MKTNRTYCPCDECPYSYSRNGEESNTCKICELTYFKDLRPKQGKWIDVPDYGGSGWQIQGKPVSPKYCSVCGDTYSRAYNYCPNCGAKMTRE